MGPRLTGLAVSILLTLGHVALSHAEDLVVTSCGSETESGLSFSDAIETANWNGEDDNITFAFTEASNAECYDSGALVYSLGLPECLSLYEDNTTITGPTAGGGYAIALDGSGVDCDACLGIYGRNITLKNLTFKNCPKMAVQIEGRMTSSTGATLEQLTFENNGATVFAENCTLVSNSPIMDWQNGTYYGNLLSSVLPVTSPTTDYAVGINVLTGTGLQMVTGEAACVEGIDFTHNFHLALLTIYPPANQSEDPLSPFSYHSYNVIHATLLVRADLAGSIPELALLLLQQLASGTTFGIDYFIPDVFVVADSESYEFTLDQFGLFACPCYNPDVFIRTSPGYVPYGAVKIAYASYNTIRKSHFINNGCAIRVVGGRGPAEFNTFSQNVLQGNRCDIELKEANHNIEAPFIRTTAAGGVTGQIDPSLGTDATIELFAAADGSFLGETTSDGHADFALVADLSNVSSVRATVTDLLGNTSPFSETVPVPYESPEEATWDDAYGPPDFLSNGPGSGGSSGWGGNDFFDSNDAEFNQENMYQESLKQDLEDTQDTDDEDESGGSDDSDPTEPLLPSWVGGGCALIR